MLEPELMAPSGKAAGIAVLILDHTRIRDTLAEALVLVLEFSHRLCHNGLQSWSLETFRLKQTVATQDVYKSINIRQSGCWTRLHITLQVNKCA